jgi:hypothetical protein
MLIVVMLNVIMLNVVGPSQEAKITLFLLFTAAIYQFS